MSFMYNPFPYDDPRPVNRPELSKKTKESITAGTAAAAKKLAAGLAVKAADKSIVIGLDGYTTAQWQLFLNLLARELGVLGIELDTIDGNASTFISDEKIDAMIDPMLEWDTKKDPTLLFGRIYKGGYQGMLDADKVKEFKTRVNAEKSGKGKVIAVYGYGTLIPELRDLYDMKLFFDVTPKTSILRIRSGEYANIGRKRPDMPTRVIRRC